jgi:hypothetical protein
LVAFFPAVSTKLNVGERDHVSNERSAVHVGGPVETNWSQSNGFVNRNGCAKHDKTTDTVRFCLRL